MKILFVVLALFIVSQGEVRADTMVTCSNNGSVEFKIDMVPITGSDHSIWTFQNHLFDYYVQNNSISSSVQSNAGNFNITAHSATVDVGSYLIGQTLTNASFFAAGTTRPEYSDQLMRDNNSNGYFLVQVNNTTLGYYFQSCVFSQNFSCQAVYQPVQYGPQACLSGYSQ